MATLTLVKAVSDYYGVHIQDIFGRRRTRHLVRARHMAAFLLREMMSLSYPAIGRELGNRDHTTAMHAVARIRSLVEFDTQTAHEVGYIADAIRKGGAR